MPGQYQGLGYVLYYFKSHFKKLGDQVVRTWSNNGGKHLSLNIDVRHWPAIPRVIVDIGKKVEAMHGPLFRQNFFMGIANISKMESEVPSDKSLCENHNKYHGNRMGAHIDSAREGEIIITLQLTESIIFYLKNGSDVVKESILGPGSGYIMSCPDNHYYNVETRTNSCDMKFCPRHKLYHAIECAHSSSCPFHHDASSATVRLGPRKGPRFAVIMRYFKI